MMVPKPVVREASKKKLRVLFYDGRKQKVKTREKILFSCRSEHDFTRGRLQ